MWISLWITHVYIWLFKGFLDTFTCYSIQIIKMVLCWSGALIWCVCCFVLIIGLFMLVYVDIVGIVFDCILCISIDNDYYLV